MAYKLDIPPRIKPSDDNGYFEQIIKAMFKVGFSFQVINTKWGGFREVFQNFDIQTIAGWSEDEIIAAASNTKIVRNLKKIRAVVHNANVFLDLLQEFSSFESYLNSNRDLEYEERSKAIAKKFKWLGKTGVYVFLYCVDEPVPEWEQR
jgi:DNA-3-methyladenine glycosylase I